MHPLSNSLPTTHQANNVNCSFDYMQNLSPDECLRAAISRNDFPAVAYVLANFKVNFSALDIDGQNPVHSAIEHGRDDDIVNLLIERAANCGNAIHEVDRNGYTPLMLAVERGNIRLASYLIVSEVATYCEGHDAECPAARLARKQQTLVHTRILVENDGDIVAAHRAALDERVDSFEQSLSPQHDNLKRACQVGDLRAATAIIHAGVDPSFVLMRTLHERDQSVSPQRAMTIRNLIGVGADVTEALKHAASLAYVTAPSNLEMLMMFGASACEAMDQAGKIGGIVNVMNLHRSRANWGVALVTAAINGNVPAMEKWLGLLHSKAEEVLIPMVNHHRASAIKRLLEAGLGGKLALMHFLNEGNTEGVRLLISAGADISTVMQEMIRDQKEGPTPWVRRLEVLNKAGANLPRVLLDTATGERNLPLAKQLIAAGVSVEDAVALAPENNRSDVRKVLGLAAQDVAIAEKMMRNTDFADITLVEDILIAQERNARPTMIKVSAQLKSTADKLQAEGNHAKAQLLRAIAQIGWGVIKGLVPANQEAAAEVLLSLLKNADIPSSRLLVQARTDISSVIRAAITNMDHALIVDLIAAGANASSVLANIIDSGELTFAREVLENSKIDLLNTFKFLQKSDEKTVLKKLIPLSLTNGSDELIAACTRGDIDLARALVLAGADADGALYTALASKNHDAAISLRSVGGDRAAVLARFLTDGNAPIAEALIVLGADLDVALTHVDPKDMGKVTDLLRADTSS